MKKRQLAAIALTGGLALAGSANAASINSLLLPGINLLQDNSAEYLLNCEYSSPNDVLGSCSREGNTLLEVGDRLRGIFDIEKITPFGIGDQNVEGPELTGIFEIQVLSSIFDDKGNADPSDDSWDFIFGPSASFQSELDGLGFSNTGSAMVALFEDAADDYNRVNCDGGGAGGDDAETDCVPTATGGTPFWMFGLDGVDDFWQAFDILSNDVSVIGTTAGSAGEFNVALSLQDNPSGPMLNPQDCFLDDPDSIQIIAEACGSGRLLQNNIGSDFDSLDDFAFQVDVVPTPATIALLGLGLLGLGASTRRNKK